MKLRGAIIGFGFIASKGHCPAYTKRAKDAKDVEIIAVCDVEPLRLEAAKKEFPQALLFTDYDQLLDQLQDQLDFVDISTPAFLHFPMASKALEKKLHVLCEKPLTTLPQEAKKLMELAKLHCKVLFPCHNYKHAPVVKAINEVIQSGKIGKVNSVTLQTFRNTHAIGVSEWKPNWRRYKTYSGGGIAMDHGSHGLYLIFDWLGSYPKHVVSSMSNFSKEYDTEDNFDAILQFENARASMHLTWTAGVRKVIYTLQGQKGAITVDDDQIQVHLLKSDSENDQISHKATWENQVSQIKSDWMDSSHVSWFNSMFDTFKNCIIDDLYVNKDLLDACYCIETIAKCYLSSKESSLKQSIDFINMKKDTP